jgi:hypothetical protein
MEPSSSSQHNNSYEVDPSSPSTSTATLEHVNDLTQFLRVVRPDWSCPRKRGHNNILRVIDKLKSIGVTDTSELLRRVHENSINEDFTEAGCSRFSRETLDSIRKHSSFIRSLDHVKEPYYRQVGCFHPVSQLLSGVNLHHKSTDNKEGQSKSSTLPHSSTADNKQRGSQKNQPNTLGAMDAAGLGDHGGVYLKRSLCKTTSESFADLLNTSESSRRSALYLRDARPRHGRTKSTQKRPITVQSMPELSKFSASSSSSPSRSTGASWRAGEASTLSGFSPLRSRTESDGSGNINGSCNSAGEDDWDHAQLQEWSKLGHQINNQPWVAKWSRSGKNHVQRSGEIMLKEQAALDDRRELFKVIEGEGQDSPMRTYVAKNIKSRLLHEMERNEGQRDLDTQQRCMTIRKNLGLMQTARRDFSEHKRMAHEILGPVKETPSFEGLHLFAKD